MPLPERLMTARLILRRPVAADAETIFSAWASDAVATRYMSWPRHERVEDALAFVAHSDSEWEAWPAGPYLICSRATGAALGSCGFGFRGVDDAEVGYILAPEAWGQGYATECLAALVEAARELAPLTLTASVHPDNESSMRVLEKCGFQAEAERVPGRFSNLADAAPIPAPRYCLALS